MAYKALRLLLLSGLFFVFELDASSQNCIPTGIGGTVINFGCNQTCTSLNFRIPHLKSSSNYNLVSVPYAPYPYVTSTGLEDQALYADDKFSGLINLPFTFCFYDSLFSKAVVGSNGLMTFEQAVAGCSNTYPITSPIPFAGSFNCGSISPAYYPRSSIMAAFSDLDPRNSTPNASPPDRKIQWEVIGTAPCRRFVVSYYHIGVFGVTTTNCATPQNTFQIVLHESTGLVEIFFEKKQCVSSTNTNGAGIFGMQNWLRDKWISAPGKNNAFWTEDHTGYRFVPSGGGSRYVVSELLNLGGTVLATADTSTSTQGILDLQFQNFCPPAGNNQFVIRTKFSACDNPATQLISLDTISINRTNGLNATITSTGTACGVPSGTITVTVPAGVGTPPYTFVLDGGTTLTGTSFATFTGVSAGPHTVVVTDASGVCTSTLNINVNSASVLLANLTQTSTSCPTATNGIITVTATNGTGPYTFRLDGGAPVIGPSPYTFTNVSAGNHTVVVADASGCFSNAVSITVGSGAAIVASAASVATTCNGASNGSIIVSTNSGVGPFQISLDGGPPFTGTMPYTFNNVSAGSHTVVVSDNGGCVSNTVSITVLSGPTITTTATKTDASCNGSSTGSITVAQPNAGPGPYQYSIDGTTWQASNIFNGLAAGTYTVYYRGNNGCQGTLSITIGEPTAVVATTGTVPVICNAQSNGIINVTPSGGIGPYQYSIDGINWQNASTFNVAAGTYTVSIRDANNCIITKTVTVSQPAALQASSTTTAASCDGGNDGTITVTTNGGNANYQYSIDGTNFQASNVFNVGPGTYTITVKDNLGCTTSFTSTVALGSNFTLTPQADPTICEGSSAQLNTNSNATQYAWTPATGLSSATISNPVANPVVTTQYIVTATLGRCSGNDTVIVNVHPAPVPKAGADAFICFGQTYQLNAAGGTQYSWSPSTFLNNPNSPNPVSSPTRDITYTLSVLADANGCPSLTTDQVRIDVTPPLKVRTFPFDTVAHPLDQIMLLAIPSDSDVINYVWSPATGLSNPLIKNPVVTVGVAGDVMQYKVTTSTIGGCKGEGFVTIRVYKGPDIYVPTGFTPNGDGINDKFTPFPVGIKSYNYFRVYNRWGQLVFSTTTLHDGWDGTLGGRPQSSGTYVWMAEGVTLDGKVITKKGTITLIR